MFRFLRACPGRLEFRQMLFSPPADRLQRLDETSSEGREGILDHWRDYPINLSAYDSVVFEAAQRLVSIFWEIPEILAAIRCGASCRSRERG